LAASSPTRRFCRLPKHVFLDLLMRKPNRSHLSLADATNGLELSRFNLLDQILNNAIAMLGSGRVDNIVPASKGLEILNFGAQRVDECVAFSRQLFRRSDPDYFWTAHELFASAAKAAFSNRSRSF
jgi:hypothetical protein